MTKLLRYPFPCFCLMGLFMALSLQAASAPVDSVGIEKRDGKRYILHRVNQGQTLYAIARRYNTSVSAIRAANPSIKSSVRYGQEVRVPLAEGNLSRRDLKTIDKTIRKAEKAKDEASGNAAETTVGTQPEPTQMQPQVPVRKPVKKTEPAVNGNSGIHVVEAGQTLYSLAVRYGVPQSELRKWNSLGSDNVLIGQALIVTEKAFTARQPAAAIKAERAKPKPTPTAPAGKREPAKTTKTVSVTPTPERDRPVAVVPTLPGSASQAEPTEPRIIRAGDTAPLPTTGRRISDIGLAEVIEGNDDSGKYLALHRSAPVGTLVQVRNDVSNQSIWVKVIGRLPNTGINDRILIKLTSRAFTKLSPNDRRFRAEVSYIAP